MKAMQTKIKKAVGNALETITTFDLTCKATNLLEKALWISIFIIGAVWAYYFITLQFVLWRENPFITTQWDVELSDLNNPAVTVCLGGSTKYAVAEKLGNYYNPNITLPKELLKLQETLLLCALIDNNDVSGGAGVVDDQGSHSMFQWKCVWETPQNRECEVKM